MEQYDPQKIEPKWQKYWEEHKTNFCDLNDNKKDKFYNLAMFFYPSGDKIHIGHGYNYTGADVVGRYKRMKGFNVFQPMGADAFGLPAENYAIKTGVHPAQSTEQNINFGREQLKSLGLMYDWEKEINTSKLEYYKWTQWLFGTLYKAGLAYRAEAPVNWCPSCKTVLANEQATDRKCERCGSEVIQKNLNQWFFKITDYAEKLLEGHKKLNWPERTIAMQKNWIGRSEGTNVKFQIPASPAGGPMTNDQLEIFTTRIDTIFGVTALVLAPEHVLIENWKLKIENWDEVQKYINLAKKKSEIERMDFEKEKTGVRLKGVYAINPLNKEKVPIWIGDYVIATYGGGAVMFVPAHDERDYEFAKKYKIPIKKVIIPRPILNVPRNAQDIAMGLQSNLRLETECFTDYGELINSGKFNGLESEKAIKEITKWLEKNKLGEKTVNYRLRDWLISRQRYWGAPIPIIYCDKCGEVLDENLVELPDLKDFKPTDEGESPLARSEEFVNVLCPKCGGPAKRSTETMDTFVCSSWYFLRYLSPHLDEKAFDKKLVDKWLPVDQYVGGAEHACLHLLYARFITKVLYDQKLINFDEPFTKLNHQGMILAADGGKMSKSKGNVVIPDDYIKKYGADTFRMYVLFIAAFEDGGVWSDKSIIGVYKFLNRVWALINDPSKISGQVNQNLIQKLHYTIKKIGEDIENFKFNTAISSMMELMNIWAIEGNVMTKGDAENFLKILAPFAPHIAEELWANLRVDRRIDSHKSASIFDEQWPEYDEKLIKKDTIDLVIQVNGKMRDKIEIKADISEKEAKELVLSSDKIKVWLNNQKPKKIIFVKNKLINIVV
jgi:leucyl-tRNA synthetase